MASLLVAAHAADGDDAPRFPAFGAPPRTLSLGVECAATRFADRTVVVATALGRLGTCLAVSADAPEGALAHSDASPVTVRTLLGRRDDPALEFLARELLR
eukprot:PRCOL_00005893-RA